MLNSRNLEMSNVTVIIDTVIYVDVHILRILMVRSVSNRFLPCDYYTSNCILLKGAQNQVSGTLAEKRNYPWWELEFWRKQVWSATYRGILKRHLCLNWKDPNEQNFENRIGKKSSAAMIGEFVPQKILVFVFVIVILILA